MPKPDPTAVALDRELLATLIKGYKAIAAKLAQPHDETTIAFIEILAFVNGVTTVALVSAGENGGTA